MPYTPTHLADIAAASATTYYRPTHRAHGQFDRAPLNR